jgi:probable rRNA maturation factor
MAAAPRARSRRPPSLQLAIVGAADQPDLPVRATLRRWVSLALDADARLCLAFVDTRVGRRLNREYRSRDYATNVLTFAYQRRPVVVADIVLCLPLVRREAREQAKTLRAHLAHLVVHGVLHAQGYDHERERDAKTMQSRECRVLARLRIADPYC